MTAQDIILESRFQGLARRRFRGGILDNCKTAPMGKGYANNGLPFDIETACYLKPIIASIEDKNVRKVVIKAGVKTMKSFVVEMAIGYYCPHGIGDCTIYFGSQDMTDDQATTRIMSYLWGIPSMVEKKKTILGRWDLTMGSIKFPDKTLRLRPANLSNTQDVNLCFVGIRDAFVTGASGMIDQAIARTTQYPHDKKIIIESQGGEEGFDFDRHYNDTNEAELHVNCPYCKTAQLWNWKGWHQVRPDDFIATVPQGSDETVESLTNRLRAADRRDCGFKRGDESKVKLADGSYDENEIINGTYYECYSCGSHWPDDGENGPVRIALDQSSHYVVSRPTALPENKGFNFPQWINRRLPWGGMMLDYLKAKKAADENGNVEPIKQWWQKTAARTWSRNVIEKNITITPGSYDPIAIMENEHSRNMAVDCQQSEDGQTVGTFWYVCRVVDKSGNSRQIARGWARSWDQVIAVQKQWKIPSQRVVVDAAKWTPQIMLKAAAEHEVVTREKKVPFLPPTYVSTWYLLFGDDARSFPKHPDGQSRPYSPAKPTRLPVFDASGRKVMITVHSIRWSNLAFKLQLDSIRMGLPGMPKFEVLSREHLDDQTRLKETGDLTYEKQMSAEYLTEKKGQQYFDKLRKDNHYFDCECMLLVRMAMDGILGHIAPPTDEKV